jgi:hypothetical protein
MRRNERQQRREPNTIILDPVKGWGCTWRENPPGEPLEYKGRLVHLCYPDAEGALKPVELPPKVLGELPEDLYQARNWPQMQPIFGQVRTMLEKLQAGMWLGALGILALLVFLMFAEVMK